MKFQLLGLEFEMVREFSPGHVLTLGEAQALTSLRAERIRGALGRGATGELGGAQIARLRQDAADLDRSFEFAPRERPIKRASTELELLISELAREKARVGGEPADFWRNDASTIEQAQTILATRRHAAELEFEEL